MDARTKIAAAGLKLTLDRPYLAAALWTVRRVATTQVPAMGVDRRWRLYYNPGFVQTRGVDELAGVLYHELCHLIREHADRGGFAEDKHLWNLATDAEINDDLRAEKVALPYGLIYPETLGQPEGLLAEQYYRTLVEDPASSREAFSEEEAGPGGGKCGSCATGVREGEELSAALAADAGPGLTENEAVLTRRQVAIEVREHARSRGTVPGHWQRWAARHLEQPRVDWRRELASLVRRALGDAAGASDYRYCRPSRRQSCFKRIVLPSLRQPVPQVAVIVDTSGSMTEEMLSGALAEVAGVLRATGQREGVTVLSVDAAVHSCRRVFRADQVQLCGGGGTDMGVGLAAAQRLRPRPDIAIVITDGFTPWRASAPRGMRTVVALTDAQGASPAWARTVTLSG